MSRQETTLEESWEFWKRIVIDEDGMINMEQVKKELHDYYVAMNEVSKVYCHITGNKISKINTLAGCVIAEADANYEELYTDIEGA